MDKTVRVFLLAEVQRYKAGMREAAQATGQFATEVERHLGAMSSQRLTQVGGQLTRNVTLPILGAGAAAGTMAVNFDDAFRQMQGLAGVTADEVDGLRSSVLELAGETAQSPQKLAEALYFVRSSGIDGAAAMEALDVAARGATAGLGSAAVVADVATSAIGAYGEANITAAEAGDVLVATARAGKAEAESLAPQFGRLLPIASELGVEFHEVGAGLAFLSRSGGGAELAATNLGNVLQKLLTPAQEGVAALEAMGMTTADLRASIEQQGLLDTLLMLRSSLEANGMELGDFSRDAQFTTGVLALTRDGGRAAREVFDDLADSTGDLDAAFEAASSGPGFRFRQGLAELQVTAIELGDTIVPLGADILSMVTTVAQAFGDLPGPVRTAITVMLGMAAAAGPIMSVVGHVKELQEKLAALGPMGARVAGGLGPLAGIVGLAAIAWVGYSQRQREAEARADEFTDAILKQTGALEDNVNAVFARRLADDNIVSGAVAAGAAIEDLADIAQSSGGDITAAQDAIAGSFAAYQGLDANVDDLAVALERAGIAGTPLADTLLELASSGEFTYGMLQSLLGQLGQLNGDFEAGSAEAERQAAAYEALGLAADGSVPGMEDLTSATDAQAQSAAEAEEALKAFLDTLRASVDPVFGLLDAQLGVVDAQRNLETVMADSESTFADIAAAENDVARAAADLDGAIFDLAAGLADGSVNALDFATTLSRWVTQGSITQTQADNLLARFGALSSSADVLNAKDIIMSVLGDTGPAERAISQLIRTFDNAVIDLQVQASIPNGVLRSTGGYAGMGPVGGPQGTDIIPAWLSPGEYIIRASAAQALGPDTLNALNNGRLPTGPTVAVGSFAGAGGSPSGGGVTIINQFGVTVAAAPGVDHRALADVVVSALQTRIRDGGPLPIDVDTAQRVG